MKRIDPVTMGLVAALVTVAGIATAQALNPPHIVPDWSCTTTNQADVAEGFVNARLLTGATDVRITIQDAPLDPFKVCSR